VVAKAQDIKGLQKDLDNLCSWSTDWLMLFNVNKCKIMHFGYNNHGINFGMNGQNLIEVKERDLSIIIQHDQKWGNQCLKAANRILGMIK
jgi:hypothetical protein